MNKILITRIADNKTFSDWHKLMAEFDPEVKDDDEISITNIFREHGTSAWYINNDDYECSYELEPTEFTVSFANTLDIERVREMIARMREYFTVRSTIEEHPHFSCMTEFLLMDIDSIASKYV